MWGRQGRGVVRGFELWPVIGLEVGLGLQLGSRLGLGLGRTLGWGLGRLRRDCSQDHSVDSTVGS